MGGEGHGIKEKGEGFVGSLMKKAINGECKALELKRKNKKNAKGIFVLKKKL